MEIILLILGMIAVLVGIVGSILPVLPGPTAAWFGLVLLNWSGYGTFSSQFLFICFGLAILTIVLDYIIPARFVKKWGGSKWGQHGATAGVIIGVFFGPIGIIFGSFVGALLGELLLDFRNQEGALRSAWGSFLGFLFGTGIKLILCLVFAWYFIRAWMT